MGTRCIDGRLFRHDPQHDDPDFETDVGACPECAGQGCEETWEAEQRAEERRQEDCSAAENIANARLIAAAPELLAALQAIIHPDNSAIVHFVPSGSGPHKLLADARAAIAKATSENANGNGPKI